MHKYIKNFLFLKWLNLIDYDWIWWYSKAAKRNREAGTQIITNLTANFFGLGNGATPSGIAAVKELQKGTDGTCAGRSVCLFLVINSAAFQLIPTTVIAVRAAAGSAEPSWVIVPTWIASAISLLIGVGVFWFLELFRTRGKGKKKWLYLRQSLYPVLCWRRWYAVW